MRFAAILTLLIFTSCQRFETVQQSYAGAMGPCPSSGCIGQPELPEGVLPEPGALGAIAKYPAVEDGPHYWQGEYVEHELELYARLQGVWISRCEQGLISKLVVDGRKMLQQIYRYADMSCSDRTAADLPFVHKEFELPSFWYESTNFNMFYFYKHWVQPIPEDGTIYGAEAKISSNRFFVHDFPTAFGLDLPRLEFFYLRQ